MTNDNFFYWLQGYFEISGTDAALSHEQAECILRHVALVREWASGSKGTRVDERVHVIATLLSLRALDPAGLTLRVRACISDQFVHVIDPAFGGPEVQAKLVEAHGAPGHKPLMRC